METAAKINKLKALLGDVKNEAMFPGIKQNGITPTMKARMQLGLDSRMPRAKVIHTIEAQIKELTEFERVYLRTNRKEAHQI